jgi:peptide methionine sulfoxide reductase msrA/msrB
MSYNQLTNNEDIEPVQINMELSDLEKSVMFHKDTERAFTGKYDDFYQEGDFVCKNCEHKLYSSKAKFDAGCGWPAFDDCYEGAIKYNQDADGRRTEIVCANCKIHLGHVFEGEHLTEKNTRHCVNSVSIKYVKPSSDPISVVLGCGCFWGVEYHFKKLKGILETAVGYSGGDSENPDYDEVCAGRSGHYEVVKVTYDPSIVSYEEIIKFFFEIHDFEQKNGQGNDHGQQYLSVIFYDNEVHKHSAQGVIEQLTDMGYNVATTLLPSKPFYEGELYHQDYYEKNGHQPYCHFYKKIF